jgi:hypothetical protein
MISFVRFDQQKAYKIGETIIFMEKWATAGSWNLAIGD